MLTLPRSWNGWKQESAPLVVWNPIQGVPTAQSGASGIITHQYSFLLPSLPGSYQLDPTWCSKQKTATGELISLVNQHTQHDVTVKDNLHYAHIIINFLWGYQKNTDYFHAWLCVIPNTSSVMIPWQISIISILMRTFFHSHICHNSAKIISIKTDFTP